MIIPSKRPAELPPSTGSYQGEMVKCQKEDRHTNQGITEGIKEFLASKDIRLEFYRDEKTKDIMVRIIQNRSGRIIREVPERDMLNDNGRVNVTI